MKRVLSMAVAVLIAASVITGCSSVSKTSSTAAGQTTKLTLWAGWSGDSATQLNEQLKAYNESQKAIQVTYAPQQNMEQKLLTAIAGGTAPDVLVWDRFETPIYAPKGALLDLDSYVKKNKIDMSQFYTQAVKEMTFKNKLYGIPMDVDNRSLFYNKTIFANAGISNPPTTWAELEQDAIKCTVWKNGKLDVAGMDLSDCGLFSMWLTQAGGSMVTSDGTKTAFNDEHGLAVLNFWHNLVYEDKVYSVGFVNSSSSSAADPFVEGKLAMKYDGPWDLATYEKYANKLNYGIVTPPAGPNGDKGAMTGGFALAIPSKAKHPDQAFQFIKWWTTIPDNGVNFAKLSGNIPANIKASHEDYFTNNEYYKVLVDTMNFATIRPQCLGYADVESKATIPDFQLFMENKMTAQQALADAQKKGDDILKQAQSGQ